MLKLKKIWGVPCPSSVTSTLRFQRFHLGTPNECQLPIPLLPSVPLHARHGSIVEPPFPLLVCLPLVAWKTSNNRGGLRGIQSSGLKKHQTSRWLRPSHFSGIQTIPILWPREKAIRSHWICSYSNSESSKLVQIQDLVVSNGFLQ